jgi:molecular chaperone HtpG
MSDNELIKTKVDLAGLMEVLGKNLYSTPTVAIRELVQNAHDSCVRRSLESPTPFEASIAVIADPVAGTLAIEDAGAGLLREEIERYLATVGAGYTRKLRAEHNNAGLIGMFGLGFLSAFIVSERVDVYTTSFQKEDEGWHFSSRSGESYALAKIPARPVGTRVELTLSASYKELANPRTVRALLERYCCLLRIPIFAGVKGSEPAINAEPAPWRHVSAELSSLRKKKLRLDFAKRFESVFEPICTFELDTEHAKGLVWIQDGATYGTSDNRNVSVFVRGMLVSRDERELLPPYAGFCGGVIESDVLTPTASREDLQKDDVYLDVMIAMRECLIEGLSEVAKNEPATWRRVLTRHNEALLGAALCDDRLFELLADELKLPTSEGDLTVPQIKKRSEGKIHVSIGEKGSYEETLFRALMVPVVTGTRYASLPFCMRYGEHFATTLVRLGTKEGNEMLFHKEPAPPADHALLESLLGEEEVEVVTARFKPPYLPLVLIPDREVLLKERLESDEADKRISSAILGMARLYTEKVEDRARAQLFVNLDSPVIQKLVAPGVDPKRRERGGALLRAMSRLMSSHRDAATEVDLGATLSAYTEALADLL